MQIVEPGGDVLPDSRLVRGVVDDRRTELLEPMASAALEKLPATLDVLSVAEAWMTRLEFEDVSIGRLDDRLGI